MLLSIAALVSVALFNTALAQTVSSTSSSSSTSSTSSTTSAPATTHTVSVGADGLNFSPHETYADVGDIIEYRFYPQNHSVARAGFGNQPCIPYEDTGIGLVGFWSGFQPVALVLSNPPIFRVRVNDTDPIFYYCSAPGACFEGMIGVINPNVTATFAQQFNYTQNATLSFSPLEYFPKEVAFSRTTTATGATSTPTSTPTTTATTPPVASSHSSLGGGPIAGIAIGGFAVAALAAALIYMCGRHKTVNEILRQNNTTPSNHNSYQPTSAGLPEAHYASMQKTPMTEAVPFGNGYGAQGAETESYRSMSPPLDERTAMMGRQPMHFQQGQGSPGLGVGMLSPGSPGYPSPTYYDSQTHEMVAHANVHSQTGFRPYKPEPGPQVHELPVPSRNPSDAAQPITSATESRPFSYTDSESGFQSDRR
ncbi:hypothetical protein EG329_012675 [Mollisiaceae sp. DMI_Dod_QoI]|nr:hypothetical protein EG329_012675 [Helotiales sp. DMI_Dod_QoI]